MTGGTLPPVVPSVEDPQGSWLPNLQRWLPASWLEGVDIALKVAKVDKSPIPKQLWDLQISLVLEVPSFMLEVLWGWLFWVFLQRLYLSLRDFLLDTHGRTWFYHTKFRGQGGGYERENQRSRWNSAVICGMTNKRSQLLIKQIFGSRNEGQLCSFGDTQHFWVDKLHEMVSQSKFGCHYHDISDGNGVLNLMFVCCWLRRFMNIVSNCTLNCCPGGSTHPVMWIIFQSLRLFAQLLEKF